MQKRIRIAAHDWAAFIDRNLFEQILVSAAGVPITYLLVSGSDAQPKWLVLNPVLSILCFAFAFLRVWKTSKEEAETAAAWDVLLEYLDDRTKSIDLIIEPLYLFVLFVLPFFAVAFQCFAVVLVVFYLIDITYNRMLLQCLPRYYDEEKYNEAERLECPFASYYSTRQRLDYTCVVTALLSCVAFWLLALSGHHAAALVAGFLGITVLIAFEGVFEPVVHGGFHNCEDPAPCENIEIEIVTPASPLSPDRLAEFTHIHDEAFPPEERHFSAKFMADKAGRDGFHLWLVTLDDRLVAYAFFEVRPSAGVAFLWYTAVDASWRSHGIGRCVIRRLLEALDSWPVSVRCMLLESHSPSPDALPDDVNIRRIAFYRGLGAYWLRGLDYAVPSHTNKAESIQYDIMLFNIAGPLEPDFVRQAVRELAAGVFDKQDDRARRLETSLPRMFVQDPPEER